MITFEDYFNKRAALYNDCYDNYDYGVDELTGLEVKIRNKKSKISFGLVEKNVHPHDIKHRYLFVGLYFKHYSGRNSKYLYYEILDIKTDGYNALPIFKLKLLSKNFYSKSDCMKIVNPSCFNIMSKSQVIEDTGWIDGKRTLYKNKNLYVLKNEIGRIKIGISEDVEQRVKSLSNSAGMKIDILRVIIFNGNLEWQLHRHFKEKRYIGEWFDLNSEDIDLLLSEDLEDMFVKSRRKHRSVRKDIKAKLI